MHRDQKYEINMHSQVTPLSRFLTFTKYYRYFKTLSIYFIFMYIEDSCVIQDVLSREMK